MITKITQEKYFDLIEEMAIKHMRCKPKKRGEIPTLLMNMFEDEKEEKILSNILDFDSKYETENVIVKEDDSDYYWIKRNSKRNEMEKIKTAAYEVVLEMRRKQERENLEKIHSLKQLNNHFSYIFSREFVSIYPEKAILRTTNDMMKKDANQWKLEELKRLNIDQFTIKRLESIEAERMNTFKFHAFIEIKGRYYDIENLEGVENPLQLEIMSKKIFGE